MLTCRIVLSGTDPTTGALRATGGKLRSSVVNWSPNWGWVATEVGVGLVTGVGPPQPTRTKSESITTPTRSPLPLLRVNLGRAMNRTSLNNRCCIFAELNSSKPYCRYYLSANRYGKRYDKNSVTCGTFHGYEESLVFSGGWLTTGVRKRNPPGLVCQGQ